MELIDRQAVIEALHKKRIETMEKGQDVNHIWECLDVVAQVPSAQPEPHWIPCSERLPEDEGYVLVTTSNGNVTNAKYWQRERLWVKDLVIMRVEAWMPLPEPYEEG